MRSFRFFARDLPPLPASAYRQVAVAPSDRSSAPATGLAPARVAIDTSEENEAETQRARPGRIVPVTHRVVLADDHEVVRQSIKRLLNQDPQLRLVAECQDGLETLSRVRELQPDVLVTDLMMPGMNGMEVTRRIRLSFPATRVIVVSVNGDAPYVAGAFQCGASGFVLKNSCGRHLLPAIRAVLSGRTYVSPPLSEPSYR